MTVATPKGLWQDYDSINEVPGAVRTRTYLNDDLMIGLIDTFRLGYDDDDKLDSYNNVLGVDFSYDFDHATNIVGEFAFSNSESDKSNSTYKRDKDG